MAHEIVLQEFQAAFGNILSLFLKSWSHHITYLFSGSSSCKRPDYHRHARVAAGFIYRLFYAEENTLASNDQFYTKLGSDQISKVPHSDAKLYSRSQWFPAQSTASLTVFLAVSVVGMGHQRHTF